MSLASVPALHEARDRDPVPPWMSAARGDGTCIYHEHYPGGDATAPASEENPTMVEVSPGHLVTCGAS